MAETIQIRCNGEGKHINTVNIKEFLEGYVDVYRGDTSFHNEIPERMVKRCAECSAHIIVTKQMVTENLDPQNLN